MECETPVLKDMVASNSTTYRKTYSSLFDQDDCVAVVLRALNRHADIAQEPPLYANMLGLPGRTDDVRVFLDAVYKANSKLTRTELIRKCNQGEFGGVVFTGHGSLNIDHVDAKQFQIGSPIVYCNEFAKALAEYGKHPHLMLTDPRLEGYRARQEQDPSLLPSSSSLSDEFNERLVDKYEKTQRQLKALDDEWDF
jgi:hypothetical protein